MSEDEPENIGDMKVKYTILAKECVFIYGKEKQEKALNKTDLGNFQSLPNQLHKQGNLIINIYLKDHVVEAYSNQPEKTSINTKGSCYSLGGSKLALRYDNGKKSNYPISLDFDVKLDLVVSHAKGVHVYGTSESNMDYTIIIHGIDKNHVLRIKPWIKKINLRERVKQYQKSLP